MGGQVSKIMGKIFGSREMRLLMLGLDAAGKTSTLSLPWPLRYTGIQKKVADGLDQRSFISLS